MRRIKQLADHNWLRVEPHFLPRFAEPTAPVASGGPGPTHPNCGRIAYQLLQSWNALNWRSTTIIAATHKTAAFFGLSLPRTVSRQVAHDTLAGEVALFYFRQFPEQARFLRGEDLMAHTRMAHIYLEKIPDAFVLDAHDLVRKVIEIGTDSLSKARCQAFVNDATTRRIAWEIWGA